MAMVPRSGKIFVLLGVAGCVAVFFLTDLHQFVTLATIKSSQVRLVELYRQHRLLFLCGYFLAYVFITGLSLPGAAVVSLAGGAIMGFWPALIVVSFASSLGATLACFFARYLFRDWVQAKFKDRLTKIEEGFQRDGSLYLFTMRLIPVIPFFVINLAMGLTSMPLRTFYWVSQMGMLPGTVVFINAGQELGRIDSLSGILSFRLIAAFALLGIFPLVVKRLISWYEFKRRTPKPNQGAEKTDLNP